MLPKDCALIIFSADEVNRRRRFPVQTRTVGGKVRPIQLIPALSGCDSCQGDSLARCASSHPTRRRRDDAHPWWRRLYIETPQWRRPLSRCNFNQTALQLTSFCQAKMSTTAASSMTPSSPISLASTRILVRRSLRADERRINSTL